MAAVGAAWALAAGLAACGASDNGGVIPVPATTTTAPGSPGTLPGGG